LLCRQEDFAPLTDEPWDVGRVCGAIARIVADVDEAFRRQPLWPAPSDSPVDRAGLSRRFTRARRASSGRSTLWPTSSTS
jgi:hypothetical protein